MQKKKKKSLSLSKFVLNTPSNSAGDIWFMNILFHHRFVYVNSMFTVLCKLKLFICKSEVHFQSCLLYLDDLKIPS